MSSKHDPADCLADIVENADQILSYLRGVSQSDYMSNRMLRDAVERCLGRVCEATFRLGRDAATYLPGQPAADIRGFGNKLRHAYDGLDQEAVWVVATRSAPELARVARQTLARLEPMGGWTVEAP